MASQQLFGGLLTVLLLVVARLHPGHGATVTLTSGAGMEVRKLQRTQVQHKMSMAMLTRKMSVKSAMTRISAGEKAVSLLEGALQSSADRSQSATGTGKKNKAEEMLNEMIEEVQSKYDMELQKCCDYDKSQSALIEEARQDISMFNGEAAEARKDVLESQDQIQICEIKLPELDDALGSHQSQCREDKAELQGMLKLIQADLSVMSNILQMTSCKKTLLLQRCYDSTSGCSYVDIADDAWRSSVNMIQSASTRQMLSDGVYEAASFGSDQDPPTTTEMPTTWSPNVIKKSTMPRSGPCKAPSPTEKGAGKCSMDDNPNCEKMVERFMYIEAGIQDKEADLMEQISTLEGDCEKTKLNLDSQISDFETQIKDQQTMLAGATKKQNNAEEQSRLKSDELKDLNKDYAQMTDECHANYKTMEGEECGLKKIRGELAKMSGTANAFFQDCVVSEWLPGDCSASCGGGVLLLQRTVVTPPKLGAPCPLLKAQKECNDHKCPIDCKMNDWTGWSGCTAKCGGGIMERMRTTAVEAEHGGEPCGETSEATSCSTQSCDKDCELSDWTAWSDCSKACDEGTNIRRRTIVELPVGNGVCPKMDGEERLDQQRCNSFPCQKKAGEVTLHCESRVDVILLIDGSGSLGQTGWDASIKAAAMLARAFQSKEPELVKLAVILFSLKTEVVTHFTTNMEGAAASIEGLKWARSITRTANALDAARSELSLGRADAESVVVVITDGKPMSFKKTRQAAKALRKQARLMWVPVTKYAPIDKMRRWASKPMRDNFLAVASFKELEEPATLDLIVADVCKKVE
jgi:uncharacterized protein YegL